MPNDLSFALTDPESLLIAVFALLAIIIVLLLAVVRRMAELPRLTAELRTLAAATLTQQATIDVLERRQAQLQGLIADDAVRLREDLARRIDDTRAAVQAQLGDDRARTAEALARLREQIGSSIANYQQAFEKRHGETGDSLHGAMRAGLEALHEQVNSSLLRNATELGQQLERLTRTTDERLREIGGQVDRRLAEGFEKTTTTFADVVRRLALIDEAQKKITALSGDVVSLQKILADKRSRGAFGEVQLAALVQNVLPAASFSLQHKLPNERIADCVLYLPQPTGTVAIDSKFPLESYQRMVDAAIPENERLQAERQFKQDIKKHIRDIAARYIIPGVTADGAVMFIPAEAVFAEIQAHHPDLVEEAHAARVWMVSPTTLWAILNTACSVLKDAATREQVDIIQEHLGYLAKDFKRFRERMDQLARHIEQAGEDVRRVHTSAAKISDRFEKIERVELEPYTPETLEAQPPRESS